MQSTNEINIVNDVIFLIFIVLLHLNINFNMNTILWF